MTSLVLAFAAGAAASSFGLGPIGIGLAQMGGGLIGGALFGPKMPDVSEYGARLADLRITTSGYGSMVPVVFGTMRIPSNIIWATGKVETAHVSSYGTGGGKGGGGGTVTQTSYSYSVSFASGLCEGPVGSVRRIWANGSLIYDIGVSASQDSVAASSSLPARLHKGGEEEPPDSLIEAHEGDTPAYRGTAHMVFENLQLAPYGNDIPNLEFEVAGNSSKSELYRSRIAVEFGPHLETGTPPYRTHISGGMAWALSQDTIFLANLASGSVRTVSLQPGRYFYSGSQLATRSDGALLVMEKPYYYDPGNLWIVTPDLQVAKYPISVVGVGGFGLVLDRAGILWAFGDAWQSSIYRVEIGRDPVKAVEGLYNAGKSPLCHVHPYIYFSEGGWLYRFDVDRMTVEPLFHGGYYGIQAACPDAGGGFWVNHSDDDRKFVVTRRDLDGNELERHVLPDSLQWPSGYLLADSKGMLWVANQQPARNLWRLDPATGQWSQSESIGPYWNSTGIPMEYAGSVYVLDVYLGNLMQVDMERLAVVNRIGLAFVVSAICKTAGLVDTDIDVRLLEDMALDGYVITSRCTARAMLEPLMRAYFFDAVESSGRIRFVPRGSNPVLTIPEADLAAHGMDEEMPDDLFTVRQQESELPQEVSVSYYDLEADYRSGLQYARRLATSSRNKVKVDLPLALAASHAKKIAEVLLYDAWMGRQSCRFSTSMKYAYLEPTDVVGIERGGRIYIVRIARTTEESGVIHFEAFLEDPSLYERAVAGAALPYRATEIGRPSRTNLRILDIPLLRDSDDYSGLYLAAGGFTESWPGCQLYSSTDSGASFQMLDTFFTSPSCMGYALSGLGDFGSGNIFDELDMFDVKLESGELESKTELAILNGANAALIGSEIIQFRDAELVAQDTYRLSGLLRGRLGTEISIHEKGESFVLLDSNLRRIRQALGTATQLKAATFGSFLTDARTVMFSNRGNSDRPLSPVHLGGGRDADGNMALNWVRRSRTGREWRDYVDSPLGEETESYEVEILDGIHVVRTIQSSIQAVHYTAQEQIEDFGGIRNPVHFRVYQLSGRIGRGFPAEGAI